VLLNGNGWSNGFQNMIGVGVQDKASSFERVSDHGLWLGSLNYHKQEGPGLINFYKPQFKETFDSSVLINDKKKAGLGIDIQPNTTRSEYIEKVKIIQEDIRNGSYYEINYCIQFTAKARIPIDPFELYCQLNTLSPTPFSCFMKSNSQHLIGASPERFLSRSKGTLRSQPIKGTVARDTDPQKDLILKQTLTSSEKEKAENLMIVDLVRNDLTKCSDLGSVAVEKLFQVDSYAQVHQLSSIVKSNSNASLQEVLKATFPMGSMTGAPKAKVIQRINELEGFDRNLFSGSVGWFDTESGDFDFNVNIRSIFYNSETQEISFSVGSAITLLSDPEAEWDECILKAKAILEVLN
jgi:para-aminobenzoate synthetase component 1